MAGFALTRTAWGPAANHAVVRIAKLASIVFTGRRGGRASPGGVAPGAVQRSCLRTPGATC
eukprot:10236468-Lingulodinium_polyedra.AAC.1